MIIHKFVLDQDPIGEKGVKGPQGGGKTELEILKEQYELRLKEQKEENEKKIKELETKLEEEKKQHIEILREVIKTGKQETKIETQQEDDDEDEYQVLYKKLHNKFLGGK